MAKENPKIKSVLKTLFTVSVDKLIKETAPSSVSNLYVQFDAEAGEVQLYDEQEHLLHKKVIFDWVGVDVKEADFMSRMLSVLRQVAKTVASEGVFDHQLFIKPFSIYLIDEESGKTTDIYRIDDDHSSQEDELLKGLDKELDDFWEKLVSDVK